MFYSTAFAVFHWLESSRRAAHLPMEGSTRWCGSLRLTLGCACHGWQSQGPHWSGERAQPLVHAPVSPTNKYPPKEVSAWEKFTIEFSEPVIYQFRLWKLLRKENVRDVLSWVLAKTTNGGDVLIAVKRARKTCTGHIFPWPRVPPTAFRSYFRGLYHFESFTYHVLNTVSETLNIRAVCRCSNSLNDLTPFLL